MRQSQALVMTPQLMQAIKLLQLSNLDLAAYVEGELEKNPLLERAGEGEPAAEAASDQAEAPAGDDRDGADARHRWPSGTSSARSLETSRSAIEERLGTDLDNVFPDDGPRADARAGVARNSRRPIRNGRAPAAAAARTATTISNPSFRRRRRWPIISPSN